MAAGAKDLCLLADLKAWLPVTGTTEDTMLQHLITNVSAWIEQWLSRSIYIAATVEMRDGTGTGRMVFANFPVTAVTAVEVDGVAIPLADSPTADGYYFTEVYVGLRGPYRFTRGSANVKLAYSAGYATNQASVPAELEQCALELCALRYRERASVGVSSKNLGGEQVVFDHSAMPRSVAALLENYKRRVPM